MMLEEKLKRLLDVLYNRFWRKWRGQTMDEQKWALFVQDVDILMDQGENYKMAADLIMSFVGEMERRHPEGKNENHD